MKSTVNIKIENLYFIVRTSIFIDLIFSAEYKDTAIIAINARKKGGVSSYKRKEQRFPPSLLENELWRGKKVL